MAVIFVRFAMTWAVSTAAAQVDDDAEPDEAEIELSLEDPYGILQESWAAMTETQRVRFSGVLEKQFSSQGTRLNANWSFTGAYVSPDRQYLTYPAIGDVGYGEVIQIADEAWIRREDGGWGTTDPRYAPPFTFWSITSDELAPLFLDLAATDEGGSIRLSGRYDIVGSLASDATRDDLGFDDLPPAQLAELTGSLSLVVDRATLRIQQLEVIQILGVLEPLGPAVQIGPRRPTSSVEARLVIDYADFDDPTITIDPPFTPRPVSTYRPDDIIGDLPFWSHEIGDMGWVVHLTTESQ